MTTVSEMPSFDAHGAQLYDMNRELFDLDSTRTPEFVNRADNLLTRIRDVGARRDVRYLAGYRRKRCCCRVPRVTHGTERLRLLHERIDISRLPPELKNRFEAHLANDWETRLDGIAQLRSWLLVEQRH